MRQVPPRRPIKINRVGSLLLFSDVDAGVTIAPDVADTVTALLPVVPEPPVEITRVVLPPLLAGKVVRRPLVLFCTISLNSWP